MSMVKVGDPVLDFIETDMHGNEVRLSNYRGKKVILVFFRYATCPFCTIRYSQLAGISKKLQEQNTYIIGVFESSSDYIMEYIGRRGLAFPIIADPEGKLYKKFGIKKSLIGLMMGMLRMPTMIKAMLDPDYNMALPDGPINRIPADFLINEDQIVQEAYYGSDIGSHIPFTKIETFANNTDAVLQHS